MPKDENVYEINMIESVVHNTFIQVCCEDHLEAHYFHFICNFAMRLATSIDKRHKRKSPSNVCYVSIFFIFFKYF